MGWSEDAARNRDLWTKSNAEYTDAQAARKWAQDEVTWGLWGVPESRIGVLGEPANPRHRRARLRTAYMSAVFAKQGARPVGVASRLRSSRRPGG
jgi:hypothetical protein